MESMTTEGRPGSIALTGTPGRLAVASEVSVGTLVWPEAPVTEIVEVETPGTGNRLNDGRATPGGSMVVGSMYGSPEAERFAGAVHVVTPEGVHRTIRQDTGVSNGQAFSVDGSTYYFADSLRGLIWAYDWDPDTESPKGERVFFDFDGRLPGRPDGACVDAEGAYWIACVGGGCVARITPAGHVERVVEVPVEHPTMPAFGGADLDVLFVTSLGGDGSPRPPTAPGPGAVFALDVGVRGVLEPLFGG